ncbi:MAG: hypothetical protein AB1813_21580, partial [Verrucomicrobiota bacterium]
MSSAPAARPEFAMRKRTRWIALVISVAVLAWIFSRIDLRALQTVLRDLRWEWFLGAIVLFGFGQALAAGRWHLVL